jgi:hypothetical protein
VPCCVLEFGARGTRGVDHGTIVSCAGVDVCRRFDVFVIIEVGVWVRDFVLAVESVVV